MQVIKFFISDQRLWRYTSGVITEGADLKFEFVFKTEDWNAVAKKTAVFSYKGKNYEAELDENNQCYVRKEAIHDPCFKVSLYGGGLLTNTVKIPVEPKEDAESGGETTSSGVVFVPHIDGDKILSWTVSESSDNIEPPAPVDLNPFDEWTEDGDINSEYEWEEE